MIITAGKPNEEITDSVYKIQSGIRICYDAAAAAGECVLLAHEGLEILGVAGSGKAREFAEIVASTVLAGELSLVGAIAAGHLARAHQQHGRG